MSKESTTIYAADLFCGAGGATAGLMVAARDLGCDVNLVAVNHWDVAIDTHKANFPGVLHYQQKVGKVDPLEAVPGGYLDILLAGPECTHHSRARGGKPKNKQSRATAFDIIHWLEVLDVRNVLVENVEEFREWGPLDEHDRPIPRLKGHFFRLFVSTLRELGYTVEWRVLCAADYGDPTSRRRLFLQATKNGRPAWPSPTHRPAAEVAAFPGAKPWVAAREIIDWSLRGESIYARKTPLRPNTLRRIFTGIRKFAGVPFVVPNFGEREGQEPRTHSLDRPLPTPTSHGAGALVEPALIVLRGTKDDQIGASARALEDVAPTLCAQAGHLGVAEPFLTTLTHTCDSPRVYELGRPSPTLTCAHRGEMALIDPYLYYAYNYGNGAPHPGRPAHEPMPTVTATWDHIGIVEPLLVGAGGPSGQGEARPITDPMLTLLGQNHRAVCEPILVRYNGGDHGDDRSQTISEPITTLDTANRFALCQFVVKYYGNGECAASLADPLATVTAHDRFGLVELVTVAGAPPGLYEGRVVGWLDILFRMLQPHELAQAHSFPRAYVFTGTKTQQTAQIGNSWPVAMAAAIQSAMLLRPGGRGRRPGDGPATFRGPREGAQRARYLIEAPSYEIAPSLFDAPHGVLAGGAA